MPVTEHHPMWHPLDFWPWWIIPGFFWTLIFWGFIAWVVVTLVNRDRDGEAKPRGSRALEILEERYARGEIDREEFEEKRRTLRGS